MADAAQTPVLQAREITKRFEGVTALKGVSFDLRAGEIHALCGENGAGKSTLIKLLSGIHPVGSYEGELEVDGVSARFTSIADAHRAGISVIYQELALVEEMTVAENIFLGAEPRRGALIDWPEMGRRADELLRQFDVAINAMAVTSTLGVGQKQLVEIVKALSRKARILILDEPTAALAEHEVVTLLRIVRELRGRGIACIYISHKLDEVFAVADRITILRDGATVGTVSPANSSKTEVIRQMVGRELSELFPRRPGERAGALLTVRDLTVAHPRTGDPFLRDVAFTLHAGEVLGIGGLLGAGRTELLMHLFGAWGERLCGAVELGGQPLDHETPARVLEQGVALVTEDRRRYGLINEQPLGFNLSLSALRKLRTGPFIDRGAEFKRNQFYFDSLHVKAPGLHTTAARLSGGNQQKIVLGKALMTEPRVIFLDEPTRGIDVGAKVEIYEIINELTASGKGVLIVSSELPELIGMSDRILILQNGRIAREFARGEGTPERLMAAALGQQTAEFV